MNFIKIILTVTQAGNIRPLVWAHTNSYSDFLYYLKNNYFIIPVSSTLKIKSEFAGIGPLA